MAESQLIPMEECQREEAKIYQEIGRAIAEWSLVEEWLTVIYALSLDQFALGGALHASFNSLNSVQIKLKMIREALNHVRTLGIPDYLNPLHVSRAEKWSGKRRASIQKIIEGHNDNRNKLAHGALIFPDGVGPDGAPSLPVWAPFFDSFRYQQSRVWRNTTHLEKEHPKLKWSATDIANIRQGFSEVQNLLSEFTRDFKPGP